MTDDEFLHTSVNGDIYALVDKPPKYQATPSETHTRASTTTKTVKRSSSLKQIPTSAERRSSEYDIVADPTIMNPSIEDLYASVQKPLKDTTINNTNNISTNMPDLFNNSNNFNRGGGNFNINNNVIYPAGFRPGKKQVSDGMLNTKYFPNVVGRKPPPMPRPYAKGVFLIRVILFLFFFDLIDSFIYGC